MRFEIFRDKGHWYWRIVTSDDDRTIATSTDGYEYPGDAMRVLNWIPEAIMNIDTRVRILNSKPDSGYVEIGLTTAKMINRVTPEIDGEPTVGSESATG